MCSFLCVSSPFLANLGCSLSVEESSYQAHYSVPLFKWKYLLNINLLNLQKVIKLKYHVFTPNMVRKSIYICILWLSTRKHFTLQTLLHYFISVNVLLLLHFFLCILIQFYIYTILFISLFFTFQNVHILFYSLFNGFKIDLFLFVFLHASVSTLSWINVHCLKVLN